MLICFASSLIGFELVFTAPGAMVFTSEMCHQTRNTARC